MSGLTRQPLVRGGELGSQLGNGCGLLIRLSLCGPKAGLEGDPAVFQSAILAVILLEGDERSLEARNLAGLIFRTRPQGPDLPLEGGLVDVSVGRCGCTHGVDRRFRLRDIALRAVDLARG